MNINVEDVKTVATQKLAADLISKLDPAQMETLVLAHIKHALTSWDVRKGVEVAVTEAAVEMTKEILKDKKVLKELRLEVSKTVALKLEGVAETLTLGI